MFSALFKQKKQGSDYSKTAQCLYECSLSATRQSEFYTKYGVPDSFDGRFDLLLVHIFIILSRLQDTKDKEIISQEIFDTIFKNMDQTLREMGIGDMGIPKHMRRMMKAFNGRMHAYQGATDPSKLQGIELEGLSITSLEDALKRNLYGTVYEAPDFDPLVLNEMAAYIRKNLAYNKENDVERLLSGRAEFVSL